MKNIQLISTKKLHNQKYKYEYTFLVDGITKITKFGASGYSDYTIHKDINRRNIYIGRHLKDLKTDDPTRAGYLSMYILWNFPIYSKSLSDYRRRLVIFNKTGIFPKDINRYASIDKQLSFGYLASIARLVGPNAIKVAKDITKDFARQASLITAELAKQQINKQVNKIKKCKDDDKDCVEFGQVPKDVLDKKLYLKIKNKLKNKIEGRRWGVYDSARLIKRYKDAGGKYSKTKKVFGTDRWFKEKWIDACAWTSGLIEPCGRSNTDKQKIKYCRPLYRVTDRTPKTVNELGKESILKLCAKKRKNPEKRIFA